MPAQSSSTDLPPVADCVVVGGGIMGASIAFGLRAAGMSSVTLIERQSIASGASGRTGALLRQHYTNRPEATLAHESLRWFRNWQEIFGESCGFEETGMVVTIPIGPDAEANVDRLRTNIALQRSIGIATTFVSPAELAEIDPRARVDDVAAAAYEPLSGCVDAVAATQSMARAAQSRGVHIAEGTIARSLVIEGDRITGVDTDRGRISGGAVVLAAGPWTPALTRPIGIDLPIHSARVQVVTLLRPVDWTKPHPAYVDIAAGMFCRPLGPGRTMVGVSGGDQHDAAPSDSYVQTADAAYPDLARAALAWRYPDMAASTFLSGHAGLYDMTPDCHPIIGSLPIDGLYVAAGFSGAGFKKGPAVGRVVAELVVHGQPRDFDLAPFRLERFAEPGWARPWSESEYALSTDFGHKF